LQGDYPDLTYTDNDFKSAIEALEARKKLKYPKAFCMFKFVRSIKQQSYQRM